MLLASAVEVACSDPLGERSTGYLGHRTGRQSRGASAALSEARLIRRRGPAVGDVTDKLDKAFKGKGLAELADAPVDALQGVSAGDAEHLKAAFNIETVRDLGTNKFFLWAQAIAKLAE